MATKATVERVTFSPGEFAKLFGKSQTWGYRQIYAGKVKAITEYGRTLIPATEVEKILGTASRYEGRKKPARTKREIEALKPELKTAWREFLRQKRSGGKSTGKERRAAPGFAKGGPAGRRAALDRLAKGKGRQRAIGG
jgi:hypothetical protein